MSSQRSLFTIPLFEDQLVEANLGEVTRWQPVMLRTNCVEA